MLCTTDTVCSPRAKPPPSVVSGYRATAGPGGTVDFGAHGRVPSTALGADPCAGTPSSLLRAWMWELTLATGWSAVAIRGLPAIGRPPRLPTVVRAYPARRGSARTPFGVIRATRIPAEHYAVHADCPVVSPAWMACDMARTVPRSAGLVVADAVLRASTSRTDPADRRGTHDHWPLCRGVVDRGTRRRQGRVRAGNAGRLSCLEGGLPVPLSTCGSAPDTRPTDPNHLSPGTGSPRKETAR